MNPHDDASTQGPIPDSEAIEYRKEEIMRAAELGKQRSEHEQEIKKNIRENREAEEKRAHIFAAEGDTKKREIVEKKKEYRVMAKKREQELADDKKRREKEAQLLADAQKASADRRKVQQGYMKELHETSLIKQEAEKRQRALLLEREREQKKAVSTHRTHTESALHADIGRKEVLEREVRDHKASIDADVKVRLYQLEEWKRSRLLHTDNESMQQLAHASSGQLAVHAAQLRAATEAQLRIKHKKIEQEWAERKATILQDATRRKNEVDHDFYGKKALSESELRRMIHQADTELARANEDIDQKYKELRRDTHR